jgi:hypothetical protein
MATTAYSSGVVREPVVALREHIMARLGHDKRLTDRVDGTNMESLNGLYQDLGRLHTLLR